MQSQDWEDEWDAPNHNHDDDDEFGDDEFGDDEFLDDLVDGALNSSNDLVLKQQPNPDPDAIRNGEGAEMNNAMSGGGRITTHTDNKEGVKGLPKLVTQASFTSVPHSTPMTPVRKRAPNSGRRSSPPIEVLTPKKPKPVPVMSQQERISSASSRSSASSSSTLDEQPVGMMTSSTPSGIVQEETSYKPPADISAEQRKKYHTLIRLFGDYLVRLLCSSVWKHREQGIQELGSEIEAGQYRQANTESVVHFEQIVQLFTERLVGDKVIKVYLAALELLQFIIQHLQRRYVAPATIRSMMGPMFTKVISGLVNSNVKHTKATISFLFWCSQQPSIGIEFMEPFVTVSITAKGSASAQTTYATNRLNLLVVLINAYGIDPNLHKNAADEFIMPDGEYYEGFNIHSILPLAVNALVGSKSSKTKDSAALVITKLYSVCGEQLFSLLSSRLTDQKDVKYLKAKIKENTGGELDFTFKQKMIFPLSKLSADDAEALEGATVPGPLARCIRKFSAEGLRNLINKKWLKRAGVFKSLEEYLSQYMNSSAHNPAEAHINITNPSHFAALLQLCNLGLNDKNPKVLCATMSLFRLVLSKPKSFFNFDKSTQLQEPLEPLLESLYATGIGASNRLVKESTLETLLLLASHEFLGGVHFVVKPFLTSDHAVKLVETKAYRKHLGELALIIDLVKRYSIAMSHNRQDSFHTESVMTYIVASLKSKSGDVRESSMQVVIEVYKKAGNVIMAYLSNQKPALMRELKAKVVKAAAESRNGSAPLNRLAARLDTNSAHTTPKKKQSLRSKIVNSSPVSSASMVPGVFSASASRPLSFEKNIADDNEFDLGFDMSSSLRSTKSTSSTGSSGSTATKTKSRKNRFVFQ